MTGILCDATVSRHTHTHRTQATATGATSASSARPFGERGVSARSGSEGEMGDPQVFGGVHDTKSTTEENSSVDEFGSLVPSWFGCHSTQKRIAKKGDKEATGTTLSEVRLVFRPHPAGTRAARGHWGYGRPQLLDELPDGHRLRLFRQHLPLPDGRDRVAAPAGRTRIVRGGVRPQRGHRCLARR